MDFYSKRLDEVFDEIEAVDEGLSASEVNERLGKYGRNVLEEKKKTPLIARIWAQISDPMVLVLVGAAIISGILREWTDTGIILAVVIINTIIGLVQESKAEKAIEALKNMTPATAKVIRDGQIASINASELVPGDIVVLEAGDSVPADMRLIESSSLKIEEASLTGESVPSEKDAGASCKAECPIGDRVNMAFSGTNVTYGRGKGVVVATGMNTQIGCIANIINNAEDEETPLQKKLAEIGKILTWVVLVICVIIFGTVMFKNGSFEWSAALDAFMLSVSLAVAAIPEGLPAVVTIVMALGVTRMAKQRAIIKKLPAVETLGCTQIICSDKTGTLTQNKMEIKAVYRDGRIHTADEYLSEKTDDILLDAIYLCNDSQISDNGTETGDPTETCLKRYVLKLYGKDHFIPKKRISDMPFDSDRKMMSTVNENGGRFVYTKGAPDILLGRCTKICDNGVVRDITPDDMKNIAEANHTMAVKALRVLGVAYKPYADGEPLEEKLIFAGLTGMMDPPRPEVFEAVKKCRMAGITPIMITGDHKDTAVAIASEIGIATDASQAIFGQELDSMNDDEFDAVLDKYRVYARVSPEHKVRIVNAWKRRGNIVAMTGDGVNDAPALKVSDIGVGMGITGTDVSKGVADMVLADDNFATIVSAVEEGRKIFKNIIKTVLFLLSSNISEVLSLFVATLILPSELRFLSPVHILWINLVTDSIPAIALGMDKTDGNIMADKPRDQKKSFFADGLGTRILLQGLLLSVCVLFSYFSEFIIRGGGQSLSAFLASFVHDDVSYATVATTMAFITLSTSQLVYAFVIKRSDGTVFSKKTFDNPIMIWGFIVPMLLTVCMVEIPALSSLFNVAHTLTLEQWALAIGMAFMTMPVNGLVKICKKLFVKK